MRYLLTTLLFGALSFCAYSQSKEEITYLEKNISYPDTSSMKHLQQKVLDFYSKFEEKAGTSILKETRETATASFAKKLIEAEMLKSVQDQTIITNFKKTKTRVLINEVDPIEAFQAGYSSFYSPSENTVYLVGISALFTDGVIGTFMELHEKAHALQASIDNPQLSRTSSRYIEYRYLQEDHAMSWEWAFLHIIPKNIIKNAIDSMQEHPELSDGMRKLLHRALSNNSLSLKDYLQVERSNSRYSKSNLFLHTYILPRTIDYKRVANLIHIAIFGGGSLGLTKLLELCSLL